MNLTLLGFEHLYLTNKKIKETKSSESITIQSYTASWLIQCWYSCIHTHYNTKQKVLLLLDSDCDTDRAKKSTEVMHFAFWGMF